MSLERNMERLPWNEVRDYLVRAGDQAAALIPVGAVEPHGFHIPLGTDNFIAAEIASRVADEKNCIVFPVLSLGVLDVGYMFDHLAGSTGVSAASLTSVSVDIGASLAKQGFRRIVFINCHGPNAAPLTLAAFEIHKRSGAQAAVVDWWSGAAEIITELKGFNYGNHGDRIETSLLLATKQAGLVDLSKAIANSPTLEALDQVEKDVYLKKISYTHTFDERWVGQTGNMGDPTSAKAEDGERIIQHTVMMVGKVLDVLAANLARRS
jgi:creatinine amidohydrolase